MSLFFDLEGNGRRAQNMTRLDKARYHPRHRHERLVVFHRMKKLGSPRSIRFGVQWVDRLLIAGQALAIDELGIRLLDAA